MRSHKENMRNLLALNLTFGLPKGPYLQSKMKSIPREISSILLNGDSEDLPWCLQTGIAAEINALRQLCGKEDYSFPFPAVSLCFKSTLNQNAETGISSFLDASVLFYLTQKSSMSCLSNAQ